MWLALGGLGFASWLVVAQTGHVGATVSLIVTTSLVVALVTAAIHLTNRWCQVPKMAPTMSLLAGMGALLFLLNQDGFLTLWFAINGAAAGEGGLQSVLNVSVIQALLSTISQLCGALLVVLTLSVLSVELPVRWLVERVVGREMRRDLLLEFRFLSSLAWLVYGWPLVDAYVRRAVPEILRIVTLGV